MKQIASRLGVSSASVHLWTKDIEIAPDHAARNLRRTRKAFAALGRDQPPAAARLSGGGTSQGTGGRRTSPGRVHAVLGGGSEES